MFRPRGAACCGNRAKPCGNRRGPRGAACCGNRAKPCGNLRGSRDAYGLIAWVLIAAALVAGCRSASPRVDVDAAAKATARSAEEAEIAALPDGPAKALVTERCLLCHSAGLITQQRKDAAAWTRTVAQMRTWGTSIQDQEQATIVAYLSDHFGSGGVRR
jgi:cytochrome c5